MRYASRAGFSLLEMLVALLVFGVIAGVVTAGVSGVLQLQGVNEAATSSQAKLRRVTEVFTQELRSAVLGGIATAPYAPSQTSISFTLLDGGAGYQVLPHDSGNNASFVNAANVRIVAAVDNAADLALEDGQALMVNANGQAVIFDVGDVERVGGASDYKYNVVHSGCSNTIDYTANTLLFKVRSLGFSYDADSGTLFQRDGRDDPQALAFDLDTFALAFVYQRADGTPVVRDEPLTKDGSVVRVGTLNGEEVTLTRVQLVLGATTHASGKAVERGFSGHVEMASTPSFNIQAVVPCS